MYPTPRDALADKLTTDATLAAILVGGVWTRKLEREGQGKTPEAFSSVPPYPIRPAAVVTDDGEQDDPLGYRGAFLGFPRVWLHATADTSGKAAIAAARERIIDVLLEWSFPLDGGGAGEVERLAGRTGLVDDPVRKNAIIDVLRFQVGGRVRGAT